jgi:L,D-transpeptidase ErfK/SrfK
MTRRAAALAFAVVLLAAAEPARADPMAPAPFEAPPAGYETEPDEARFRDKDFPVYTIPTPSGGRIARDSVIGELRVHRVEPGDTLMDLAREYSLGYNEMVEANPGIDPWVPPAGAVVILPTQWVLPCCTYRGVVVNIPEMRLFFMQQDPGDASRTRVQTYPVGLGRDDWRTPTGTFRIQGKTRNPQWNIPESIRKEHIAERGDHRTFIPGGAPDNPLGKFRLELTMAMYRIHGTNIPWGVGMQVSHGCIRLYPEDIEHLFPSVPVGAPGEFAYQAVKVGMRDGAIWVEAHDDIYGESPARYRTTREQLEELGVMGAVDEELLLDVLSSGRGLPRRVSPGGPRLAPTVRYDLLTHDAGGS